MRVWPSIVFVLVGVYAGNARANQISPTLQKVILDYAVQNGSDVSETKKNTEKILEKLNELQVSPCELSSELRAKNPESQSQIRYLLGDIVESKLQGIRAAEEQILLRVGNAERLSENDRVAIKRLAIGIASNSTSLTELKEDLLPRLFREVGDNLNRVNAVDLKVDLLELQLRRFDTICEKVAILWAERDRKNENQYSVLRANYEQNNDLSEVNWRSVNGTQWEPEAYATSEQLCSNPTPGPTNVVFETHILKNQGWVKHRHYGDIWTDCSGKIVMVLKKQ